MDSVAQVSYISTAVLGCPNGNPFTPSSLLSLLNVSNSSPSLEVRYGWINRYFCTSLTLRSTLPLLRSSTPILQQLLLFSYHFWGERCGDSFTISCNSVIYAAALSSYHSKLVDQRAWVWYWSAGPISRLNSMYRTAAIIETVCRVC